MIVVLQRVSRAAVDADGERVASIGRGLVLLCCAVEGDEPRDAERLADKIATLRVFEDAEGRTNLSLADVGGAALVVPQFTLAADWRKGRRPSFSRACAPEPGARLVERFAARLAAAGPTVARGRFGAAMTLELVNAGPFTLVLDSALRGPAAPRGPDAGLG